MPKIANDRKKIYILGASGYLGSLCADHMRSHGHIVFTERVEITNFSALIRAFKIFNPTVVISCAGAKAHPTVDWCEDHKEETVRINVAGQILAATAAIECGAYPIQISSGCIYQGTPGYIHAEDDKPDFDGSYYSRMRIVMQEALKELPVMQARIRMPLSSVPHERNFLNKIIGYKKIVSVPNSITYLDDLWPALEILMQKKPTGIFNLTNNGYVTNVQVLEAYKAVVDPHHTFEVIPLSEFQGMYVSIVKAKRSNCVLSNAKLAKLGIEMPELNDKRLKEIMQKYKMELERRSYWKNR
ncbi:MAG: sugar nucleotide-binding protein [Candidatus Paceibacterota bacterium]|jgi:dTDP-4-dehydrorhamnose reductase|nr:sugar nucleotide-binding protein [Candidatus Paceibacterota bacterium]